MQRISCPRCDGQGIVHTARIIATGEIVHLCDECDAIWPNGVEVRLNTFLDFQTYVEQFGLKGLWSEIEILDEGK
jgi:hypothetical protein